MKPSVRHKIIIHPENCSFAVNEGQSLLEALTRYGILLQSDCGGAGRCGKCQVRIVSGEEKADCPPDENEPIRNAQQDLTHEFRLACQLKIKNDLSVEIPVGSRFIPEVVAKPVTRELLRQVLAARELSNSSSEGYGLAVDLGTTTIGVYLCDLARTEIIASIAVRNPQTLLGADVISRISAVIQDQGNLPHLQQMAVGAIKAAARSLCETACISTDSVSQISMVGNPTMIHLVLGEDPSSIGISPYQPKFKKQMRVEAQDIGLDFNPGTKIYTPPLISGFLGADILAAALGTGFIDLPPGTLLVDMGTNGELMLKCDTGIMATSCATGPAFEGANIHHGMQAAPGAIDAVSIDRSSGEIQLSIIRKDGDQTVRPSGICGSGILSAVAEFIRSGVILESGAFNHTCRYPGLRCDGKNPAEFVIATSETSATGSELTITQKDIRSVQLAKGALSSGIRLICEKVGIKRPQKILLAGAFGNHLNLEDCRTTGLLAGAAPDHIEVVGNAAGVGAVLMMFDGKSMAELARLAQFTREFNLSAHAEFQDTFIRNLNFSQI